jgi:hypothetical protein
MIVPQLHPRGEDENLYRNFSFSDSTLLPEKWRVPRGEYQVVQLRNKLAFFFVQSCKTLVRRSLTHSLSLSSVKLRKKKRKSTKMIEVFFILIFVIVVCLWKTFKEMIQDDRDKEWILQDVGNKIITVKYLLDEFNQNNTSVDHPIIQVVLNGLAALDEELERVKNMSRFLYLTQSKNCQERLRQKVDALNFCLLVLSIREK